MDIDTAEVSILEREVLADRGARQSPWPTRLALGYLASRSQTINAVMRRTVFQWGGAAQRIAARIVGRQWRRSALLAPLYAPAPAIADQPLSKRFPRAHDLNHVIVVSPDAMPAATVFYFPGCGSERLHADIAMAAIYLLLQANVRIVLPPKYLCCGFPARANAKTDLAHRQELHNTILFNQIRSMLGHLDFNACVVSCGTCRETLERINTEDIFEAPLADVSGFVLDRGLAVELQGECGYHQPCHDSLDGQGEELLRKITPAGITAVPECCSEAGTLALSRPDIAAAMLARKRSALMALANHNPEQRLLTNCPACLNGLGRQRLTPPQHLAVVLAEACSKGAWRKETAHHLTDAELIRI